MLTVKNHEIKAILGLGNPGPKFHFTPHNIGFLILDEICQKYYGTWQEKKEMHTATVSIDNQTILLVKPQTFMNLSGKVLPYLYKQGIKQENILVIHDEIDYPFGKINFKEGGSARGHNGLRSLIEYGGQNFLRWRVGVGRPEQRSDVGNFVTNLFQESESEVMNLIQKSIDLLLSTIQHT